MLLKLESDSGGRDSAYDLMGLTSGTPAGGGMKVSDGM